MGQTAQSSLTVVVPPGSASTAAPPVVSFAQSYIQTYVRTVTLDASGSTSPSGNTPLTYLLVCGVRKRGGNHRPDYGDALGDGRRDVGEYDIACTVTDSKGNSSTGVVRIMLVPNTCP